MELPLQHHLCDLFEGLHYVSILVLMELPLQHQKTESQNFLNMCFNPCFNGTTSATGRQNQQGTSRKAVSILVLMELPLQLKMNT